jgi:hypothetical protein
MLLTESLTSINFEIFVDVSYERKCISRTFEPSEGKSVNTTKY